MAPIHSPRAPESPAPPRDPLRRQAGPGPGRTGDGDMRGIPSRAHRTLALSAYRTSASVDARKARRDPVLLQAPRYRRLFLLPCLSVLLIRAGVAVGMVLVRAPGLAGAALGAGAIVTQFARAVLVATRALALAGLAVASCVAVLVPVLGRPVARIGVLGGCGLVGTCAVLLRAVVGGVELLVLAPAGASGDVGVLAVVGIASCHRLVTLVGGIAVGWLPGV